MAVQTVRCFPGCLGIRCRLEWLKFPLLLPKAPARQTYQNLMREQVRKARIGNEDRKSGHISMERFVTTR